MSAKYKCNICGRVIPCHHNRFETYEFVNDDIRVQFIVDFNQWTENDICIPCALKAIQEGTKKSKQNVNNTNAIKYPENCNYHS